MTREQTIDALSLVPQLHQSIAACKGGHHAQNTIVAMLTGALVVGGMWWPSPASAQGRRGRVIVAGGFGYGYRPFFYDPFWGPYPYYGYGAYPIGVTQNIYVAPDDTFKLQIAMDRLQPGEASDPAPIPARRLSPSTDQ